MKKSVLSEFSFLQPFNTQQLSWCAPSITSSSTELNHAGLILCIGHVPESQGGTWLKAVTQVTGMAHNTSSGHGVASDQASTQCGASRAAQLPWGLCSVPDPLSHCAYSLEGSQIHPRNFARHGLFWDMAEATTVPEMEVCLQEGMTQKLVRILRVKFGHLYNIEEIL